MGPSPMLMVRGAVCTIMLGTCLAAPIYADVIYFKPGAVLPALPPDADVSTYVQSPTKTLTAVRGRIVAVLPNVSPTTIRFQAATVVTAGGRPSVLWASRAGVPTFVNVPITQLDSVDHEIDSLQDLRWLFSNRDQLLNGAVMRRLGVTRTVSIGYEPFNSYFLDAAGVKTLAAALPPIPNALTSRQTGHLQEGWLVNWIRNGPTTATQRGQMLEAAIRSLDAGQTLGYPTFLQETEISAAVHSLLHAATRDKIYSGVYSNIPGTSKPTFYSVLVRSLMFLCDLADESNPNARELGHLARESVIQALEAAAVGRTAVVDVVHKPASSSDPIANLTLQMRRLERDASYRQITGELVRASALIKQALDIAARILNAKPGHAPTLAAMDRLRTLQGTIASSTPAPTPTPTGSRPPLISSYFPVDPSEIAVVAMEIITGSPSWQVPRVDNAKVRNDPSSRNNPGVRLVSALMGLATEDPTGRLPRSQDAARDPAHAILVPGYGTITVLEQGLVTSLEHLFAADNSNDFRRELAAHLAKGSNDERDLAMRVMMRAGFADPDTMAAVVDRLFAVGLSFGAVHHQGDIGVVEAERYLLREAIRRDAVASLMRLGSLVASDNPTQVRIGDLVVWWAANIMENRAKGFAGESERHFFSTIRSMRLSRGTAQPMEEFVKKFEEAFSQHLNTRIADPSRDPKEAKRLRDLLNEHMRN